MTRKRVEVEITARDNFSKSLAGIKGNLNSLTTGIGLGISSTITSAVLQGVSGVIGKLGSLFKDALNIETSQIMGGNALKLSGATSNIDQGVEEYKNLTKILAEEAKKLPGSTQDYLTIMGTTIGTYSDALGLTGDALLDSLGGFAKDIVPRLSILMESDPTLQNRDVSLFTKGFFGGKTLEELSGEEMLLKNAQFKKALFNLRASGKYADTTADKAKMLEKALKTILDQDTLAKLQNSFSASIETLKDSLFGVEGVFNLAKDSMPNVEGTQSIFLQLGRVFERVFGENGFLASFGKIFNLDSNSFGEAAFNGLSKVIDWLNGINRHWAGVAASLGDDINTPEKIENPGLIYKVTEMVDSFLTTSVVAFLNNLVDNPGEVGKGLGVLAQVATGVVIGIAEALSKISWKVWVIAAGLMAFNIFLMPVIMAGVAALATVVGGFLATFGLPILAIGALIVGAVLLIKEHWSTIKLYLTAFGLAFVEGIKALGSLLSLAWEGIKSGISSAIAKVGDAIKSFFGWMTNQINILKSYAPGGETPQEARAKAANSKGINNNSNKVSNKTVNNSNNITVHAKTNATPDEIANAVNFKLNEASMRTA